MAVNGVVFLVGLKKHRIVDSSIDLRFDGDKYDNHLYSGL